MVMNMKNKWTGTSGSPSNLEEIETNDEIPETKEINESKLNDEFDVVDGTVDPNAQVTKRRGFLVI